MKKHHLFAYYCTLLVPVAALAGLGAGRYLGSPTVLVIVGAVVGFFVSWLLQRRTAPDETP